MVTGGAYGMRLGGIPQGARAPLLARPPRHWPIVQVERVHGLGVNGVTVRDHDAVLGYGVDGAAMLDRRARRISLRSPGDIGHAELVHPVLAGPAAVFARWFGWEPLHAGGVIIDGRAWALLGAKGAGKSTTLAWMASRGVPVLADDLVVVAGAVAYAGPRCLDLRPGVAEQVCPELTACDDARPGRRRVALGPVPAEVPLAGLVLLDWGEGVTAEAVSASAALVETATHRAVRLAPGSPATLLDLVALPCWRVRRPRRLSALEPAAELIQALARRGHP